MQLYTSSFMNLILISCLFVNPRLYIMESKRLKSDIHHKGAHLSKNQ